MAVYTEISEQDLSALLDEYQLGNILSLKGIAEGTQNSNYVLETTRGRYILTLYETDDVRDDLPFFLALMDHLATAGINCPTPVARTDKEFISYAATRPATIVRFLDGQSIHTPGAQHCAALGAAMARLHIAASNLTKTRINRLGQPYWKTLFESLAPQADQIKPKLARELDDTIRQIELDWPHKLEKGIIHGDLFPENVFFLNGQISGLIDFYFACNDAYAYDLAIAINAWCFESDISFNITRAQHLIRGYQSIRSLAKPEIEALPTLASGAALRFVLTRIADWFDTKNTVLAATRKNPFDYVRRLRFHRTIETPTQYGIDI